MRNQALFLNGMYEDVLEQILSIQAELPEQIMFIQPYSDNRIVKLAQEPPSVDDPMPCYFSVTTDLNNVHFTAEIVGWDDKRKLSTARRNAISRLIWTLQHDECGLYDSVGDVEKPCVNLLHIRRLKRVSQPFSVKRLMLTSENRPMQGERTTSGHWAYVDAQPLDE